MVAVRVTITKYISNDQPGFVECTLTDAGGTVWKFEEKVPVVTLEELDPESNYPRLGDIDCEIVKRWKDDKGCELVTIDTERPWGVEALDGTTRFDVGIDQLVDD